MARADEVAEWRGNELEVGKGPFPPLVFTFPEFVPESDEDLLENDRLIAELENKRERHATVVSRADAMIKILRRDNRTFLNKSEDDPQMTFGDVEAAGDADASADDGGEG